MNPFTQALLRQINDPQVHAFVLYWDALTELVIRVFKNKAAAREDEAEYEEVRAWLRRHYPAWQAGLDLYWRKATIDGAPAQRDPFAFLIEFEQAGDFAGRWDAMQHLPAAREAVNQYLADLSQTGR